MRASKAFAAANLLMLLVFVLSAIVQLNDPDPLRWIAVYGLAAVACGLAALQTGSWRVPAMVAVLALVGAALIAPRVIGKVRVGDLVQAYEMKSTEVEEGREVAGLLIVAAWMGALAWSARRREQRFDDGRSERE